MKTNALRNTILALVLAAAADAQGPAPLHANVPFNFTVGKVTFVAGKYTVEQANPGVIDVRGANGKAAFLFVGGGQCTRTQTPPRLVFHRYGDTYLLSQVWSWGDTCAREVPKGARERELEAAGKPPRDTIIAAH
ncbi:MAG TPA: hypothetical protein VHY84_05045 [Bryobacteraceae bacterium]|jgi:hypothetical protein|nr:hypothetical protein [Bryobacteraceae bacterium]